MKLKYLHLIVVLPVDGGVLLIKFYLKKKKAAAMLDADF